MTLDNDANPTPHAPRFPSDAPPREGAGRCAEGAQTGAGGAATPDRTPADARSQDSDRPDATTPRGVARAILAALPPAERAAVVAAVLSWCRALAGLAAAVSGGLTRPSALAMGDAATRVLVGDSTEVCEVDALEPAPFAPVAAVIGAWWAMGAYDLGREAAKGSVSSGDFADALAFLGGLDEAGEAGERPADAPPLARVERVELPARVERVDAPRAGTTFLPPAPAVTRDHVFALLRRAARELSSTDYGRGGPNVEAITAAERATLEVLGACDGDGRMSNPAGLLARMGEDIARVAALESAGVRVFSDPSAVSFGDRCDAVIGLLEVAADTFKMARTIARASGESIDDARWPAP